MPVRYSTPVTATLVGTAGATTTVTVDAGELPLRFVATTAKV